MEKLPESLQALAAYPQFVLWRIEEHSIRGKVKVPIHPATQVRADAHNPAIWLTSDKAIELAAQYGCGVGFTFTKEDPFFFIDIDHCLVDGAWSDLAIELLNTFPGSAVEVSQSGDGLHIIGSGVAPEHSKKNIRLGIEFYTELRFVALTGISADGDASIDQTLGMLAVTERYFAGMTADGAAVDWTNEPVPEWSGIEDDDQLIMKMCSSRSSAATFGTKATIKDLWEASDALGDYYPPQTAGQKYDASSADAALCSHLAFWTGKDCERMERLFERSGLVREK